MRSELFRIPLEWGGVPLLGIGLLLALWGLAFGAVLVRHARRHGTDEEFWGYVTPAVLGAVAIALVPRFMPEGIPIRGYGVMLLAAIGTGLAMAVHRARRHGIEPDSIFSLAFWLFVAGIVGARAFFVIEYWETRFAGQPFFQTLRDVLVFTEGGLVVYGSLIGAAIAFLVFCWRHRLPTLAIADLLAPSLAAGLAIGRLGCLLNGCCFGGACDLPWAVTFPAGSPPFVDQLASGKLHNAPIAPAPEDSGDTRPRWLGGEGLAGGGEARVARINDRAIARYDDAAAAFLRAYSEGDGARVETTDGQTHTSPPTQATRSLPIHPTQIYSAVNAGLLAWFLWEWFPRRRRDGEVALLMLSIYPVSRFLLEVIRTDEKAIFGTGLSISQNVSLVLLAGAAVGWVLLLRRPEGTALEVVPPPPTAEKGRTPPAVGA